jgi:hypothetical protein
VEIEGMTHILINLWQVEDDCDLPDALFLLAVGDIYHGEILRAQERAANRRRELGSLRGEGR